MTTAEFDKRGVDDARLAIYATSQLPAWLWSIDGTRILWANPVGAALFGAPNGAALSSATIGPADTRRRQIAQLAGRLQPDGSIRLERLRAFGMPLGRLLACACSQIEFADGEHGILIVAAEPVGRAMPLVERLQRLVEGVDTPIAAFGRDGLFVGASKPARALMAFRNLSDAGLDSARSDALQDGRVEAPIGVGRIVLQRVGSGADIGLVAFLAPRPALSEPHHSSLCQAAGTHDHPLPVANESREPDTFDEATDVSSDSLIKPFASYEDISPPDEPPIDAETIATEDAPAEFTGQDDDMRDGTTLPPAVTGDELLPVDAEPLPTAVQSTAWRNPLRFTWAIDDAGRFTLRSDDFVRLIGPRTAANIGRPWSAISDDLRLDPGGRVAQAIASHTTWSGVQLIWPVDPPGEPLSIEMAGLPVFDAAGQFAGYRGFGVARDLDALGQLDAIRNDDYTSDDSTPPRSLSAHAPGREPDDTGAGGPASSYPIERNTVDHSQTVAPQDVALQDSAPQNVVPIRPLADPFAPALTSVENSAFNELARRLSARLDSEDIMEFAAPQPEPQNKHDVTPRQEATPERLATQTTVPAYSGDWLSRPPALAQGMALRDRPLLDLMPVGVLVYRLDRLLYANPQFLTRVGYVDLPSLEAAGGLEALYVEPNVAVTESRSIAGTPVTIAASAGQVPATANLSSISWDGEPALALIFATTPAVVQPEASEPMPVTPVAGHASAEELAAILDTAAEGIVMFDLSGKIHSCNRSAEALFGRDGDTLTQGSLADLFAPESLHDVQDYVDAVARADTTNMHGREVLGRMPCGGLLPLAITVGRTRPNGPNFFAIFRDRSQARKMDTELLAARKQADRFVSSKTDLLARISHDVRTPLNAIIGFSDVMIEERFGPLGNDRYGDYIKDIRNCGERVIAIIDDLLDFARIETGTLDLAFANQNLNELVEQCVASMQPQANRERIIVRTSLVHHLPQVHADARALRQIATNLISNSIHLANAGGQVIVSTALSDLGHVVLRVRDTGHGLNDTEIAQVMEPFRTRAPTDHGTETTAVNLSLTRALVEANRAKFNIKTAPQSGTLIEVVFAPAGVDA